MGKFVFADLPDLLMAALSKACAASSSVSWSPSDTVRPRADICKPQRFVTAVQVLQIARAVSSYSTGMWCCLSMLRFGYKTAVQLIMCSSVQA